MLCPPQLGSSTLSPTLTDTGWTWPSLFGAPGPVAITLASGNGEDVADDGRKRPDAVFSAALNLWRRTRSKRGLTEAMDRIVDVAFRGSMGRSVRSALAPRGACTCEPSPTYYSPLLQYARRWKECLSIRVHLSSFVAASYLTSRLKLSYRLGCTWTERLASPKAPNVLAVAARVERSRLSPPPPCPGSADLSPQR